MPRIGRKSSAASAAILAKRRENFVKVDCRRLSARIACVFIDSLAT